MKKIILSLMVSLMLASAGCSVVTATPSISSQAPITKTGDPAEAANIPITYSTLSPTTTPPPQMITPNYTEVEITLVPGEVQRLNVFAENNDIIDYSWKSDYGASFWFTTPKGIAMTNWESTPIDPQPNISPDPNRGVDSVWGTYGLTDSVIIEGKYCAPGYYTFCFFVPNYMRASQILFRYRVEKPLEQSLAANALTGAR